MMQHFFTITNSWPLECVADGEVVATDIKGYISVVRLDSPQKFRGEEFRFVLVKFRYTGSGVIGLMKAIPDASELEKIATNVYGGSTTRRHGATTRTPTIHCRRSATLSAG